MRYKTLLIVLLSCFPFGVIDSVSAAELKIGYVDANKVLEQAPQAKAMLDRLQKEFEPRREEIENTQDKLKRLEDKLSRDGDVMSDAERDKAQRDALSLQRDLKRYQEDFQDDLNLRKNQELGKLQVKVNDAINAIGEQNKFDLILYGGIAYANPKLDLTDNVLKWLSQHNKAPDKKNK